MNTGWAANLDRLAQEGVIDYDAPASIMNTPPRYAGNPAVVPPFNPNAPKMPGQPEKDEFAKPEFKDPLASPSWKKWLFGIIAAGLTFFGGYKLFKFFKRRP